MKKSILWVVLLLVAVLFAGCAREVEAYESKRPKTANMEDVRILEMKTGQVVAATEVLNAATEAAALTETEPATEAKTEQLPETEKATESAPDKPIGEFPYDIVLTGDLNMRDGPGDEYGVTYSLEEGDTVEVVGRVAGAGGIWLRVRYEGDPGYVYKESLDLVSEAQ